MSTPQPDFESFVLNRARVVLDPDPKARRPSRLEPGDGWVLLLQAMERRAGFGSERNRQTLVMLQWDAQPPLDTPLDLAHSPRQASYEYGAQAALYISRTVTGTLLLSRQPDGSLLATLDAVFSQPTLGEGARTLRGAYPLRPHPHPEFYRAEE
ncbi:MAG TPA: hypothetical protein VFS21_13615 [Roseiflexaceae bacterium]|nr:hypothetical protein [Roseiflexaceae bacterium]